MYFNITLSYILLGHYYKYNVLTLLIEFIKLGDLFSTSSTTAGLLCEQAL